ncbi:matrixin family metalloprotease [Flavobacterium sp.]|jgi:hypothetical protein|uniref:matrixin family metalloprotease n=1 Tax=Flavobacterium sp. TaxID=239 RepID=UPI0037C13C2F
MKTTKKINTDFELQTTSFLPIEEQLHIYNNHVICVTDSKGYALPKNRDLKEIRVDASNGFIPLWEQGVTLNWRFEKSFGSYFKNPDVAKAGIRGLFGEAILAWKDACPIKFHEDNDVWDFEIAMHQQDCNPSGCVLASAFFPSPGQNTFYIYPTMFKQSREEQVETIEHEIGHIFGLRHFFANISEKEWKSELFGSDNPFSIMNYGDKSKLTDSDIDDLKTLYQLVWSGQLKEINGTEIRLFTPYHRNKERRNNRKIKLLSDESKKDAKKLIAKFLTEYAKEYKSEHSKNSFRINDKPIANQTSPEKEEVIKYLVKSAISRLRGIPVPEISDEADLILDLRMSSTQIRSLATVFTFIAQKFKAGVVINANECEEQDTVQDCVILIMTKTE